ncbi:MAG: dynamin family protein [Verrucomicrobiales bacterium]
MTNTASSSFRDFLLHAAGVLGAYPEFREATERLRRTAEKVEQPFNLAVVGRMKAGKSTLINSLIGEQLAISDVEEATATLNWICHGSLAQSREFIVHWRDGSAEPRPLQELRDWTGKSPEVIERIQKTAFLRLFSQADRLREIQVIDTPGTGSAVEAHETARDFLNPEIVERSIQEGGKADAIVYVVPPVGREQDEETLALFESGRLPNSGPYNSVCVLHKWDGLQVDDPAANAREKAERLKLQLGEKVADVIPVSAPLALTAKLAPDEFFALLQPLLDQTPVGELERSLKLDALWDKDSIRKKIRGLHGMPWASFKLVVKRLLKDRPDRTDVARSVLLEASGLPRLESFLKDRFFSQASIIKQFHSFQQASSVVVPALRRLDRQADQYYEDASRFSSLSASLHTIDQVTIDQETIEWLRAKEEDCRAEERVRRKLAIEVDRAWQSHRRALEGLNDDLKVSEAMSRNPSPFPAEHHHIIRTTCNHLASSRRRTEFVRGRLVNLKTFENLINEYRGRANFASKRDRGLFEHVAERLEEALRFAEQQQLD